MWISAFRKPLINKKKYKKVQNEYGRENQADQKNIRHDTGRACKKNECIKTDNFKMGLLFSGLLFLMVGILAALFIAALRSTTASIEYMLYRYMVTG